MISKRGAVPSALLGCTDLVVTMYLYRERERERV
jgi:hypothetical protein